MDRERSKDLCIPVSRIKNIMKHAEDTQNISQESVHMMAKVTELFLQQVVRGAYAAGGPSNKRLDYGDVADYVQTSGPLTFMREILPRKVTFREYKDIIKKKGIVISSLGESTDDSSADESDNSSSSGESESGSSASGSTSGKKEDLTRTS